MMDLLHYTAPDIERGKGRAIQMNSNGEIVKKNNMEAKIDDFQAQFQCVA